MELLNLQWLFARWFFPIKNTCAPSDKITDRNTRTYKFIQASNEDVMNAIMYLRQNKRHSEAQEMNECWHAFKEFSFRHFGEIRE